MKDVVVIGAGHAGIEAAWVCANRGHGVVLVTLDAHRIGAMSCNPAIGGQGKGQLVKELDILGGLMPRIADETGIQFRRLNTKKGPAVWSSRAQSDKVVYAKAMAREMASHPRINVVQGEVCDVIPLEKEGGYSIVLSDGTSFASRTVILTVGTFLNGVMHVGSSQDKGGRFGDMAATHLSSAMEKRFAVRWRRFKTGTPPRLKKTGIDWENLNEQKGDPTPAPFSVWSDPIANKVSCHLTYTTPEAHQVIRDNIDRAPLFNGQITSTGPRYCPSIEDKVMRFSDRPRHLLFLEPESLETDSIYVNGLSTSLPKEVQEQVIHLIPGLERAQFIRYGYAVEYDCIDPKQLTQTLCHRNHPGLYFAGQVNGSSGYEEAAAQGFIAGVGASCFLNNEPPLVLARSNSYIGVLIDDLIHKGAEEPYRMFTSRCEYRLSVREDNCVERLLPLSKRYVLLSPEQINACEKILSDKHRLKQTSSKITIKTPEGDSTLERAIRAGHLTMDEMIEVLYAHPNGDIDPENKGAVLENLYIEHKYKGYLEREYVSIQRMEREVSMTIPSDFDFESVAGLANEAKARLKTHRPKTIGQARNLYGVTPSDILVLLRSMSKSKTPPSKQTHVTKPSSHTH